MDVQGVFFSNYLQFGRAGGVSLSTASSMDGQGVSSSITSIMDVQGVQQETPQWDALPGIE